MGSEIARVFYTCDRPHETVPHADWWTDWRNLERIERIHVWDASLGDPGTTSFGVPLPLLQDAATANGE